MPCAGNIAKTMTSKGKHLTVSCDILTAGARDQSVQLKMTRYCHLNLFVSLDFISEVLRSSENKTRCSSRDQSLSVNFYIAGVFPLRRAHSLASPW